MSELPKDAALLGHVRTLMRVMLVSERTAPEHQHVVRFNPLDFHTLGMLRESGTVRASDIAESMGVAPTTASSVVARLVRQGLIARTQSAEDRRAYDLTLTPKGAERAAAIHAQDLVNMRLFLSALSEAEQAQLLELLGTVATRVAALEG